MNLSLMSLVTDKLNSKEEIAIITVISSNLLQNGQPGALMVVDQYGQIIGGGIGDDTLQEMARTEAEKSMSTGISRKILLSHKNKQAEVFINVFCHKEKLVIVGSGNLILSIYQMAINLGYRIIIVDNQPDTLTRERFPLAEQLLLGDIGEHLGSIEIDAHTNIVIASYHHEYDDVAIQRVINTPARYIGVLGNKRKVTACFSKLTALGIDDELMNRVYIPIGLDLGGQKTSEIALSVMAEIQAIKYGREGGFLSVKHIKKGIEKREELF
ncbi:MAG: XdhC family protein [Syntrophomonadaceae bacterium]